MALGFPLTQLAPGLLAGLAACAPVEGATPDAGDKPLYRGVETRLLDGDLVDFRVAVSGVKGRGIEARTLGEKLVTDYATCAAAQYTLIRGYSFARHVRTNIDEKGGIWRADAVYTISPVLPRGLRTIDAEVTVADCADQGIPTV
ncbi:hypothetical protein [Phaeovulum sp.]|uniref:hypothetical protein n=1 Tax=Phaeovulum sp. TaxID=2934796 RepID=UPI0039E6679C